MRRCRCKGMIMLWKKRVDKAPPQNKMTVFVEDGGTCSDLPPAMLLGIHVARQMKMEGATLILECTSSP